MTPQISTRWNLTVMILLALAVILRVAAMAQMPLLPEEAYYWMYSQHPSLSYFDHPPMVAWLIGFGTHLFGDTQFGVRAGIALMMFAASGAMYLFARMWCGRKAALVAALLLQMLPAYFGVGLIATMDSALLFFWLVCLLGTSIALQKNCARGWYLAGFGLGGAILSKYTGIFLGLGALLVVACHPPWRKHLRSVHPYAATLLAFAMFSPVLVWNHEHGWASFRFQFMNRFSGEPASASRVGAFFLEQIAIATPIILIGLVWLLARILRKRRMPAREWIALCFSLPLLLVMAYKSLHDDIHLNWTMPAYLSLLPALAQMGLAQWRCARKKLGAIFWQRAALTTVVICLLLDLSGLIYALGVQPKTGWIAALRPWRGLAVAVQKTDEQLKSETGREPLIIGADKYRLASELAFYRTPLETNARPSEFTTSQWILGGDGLGFVYWTDKNKWIGSDCIVVDDEEDIGRFAANFDKFEIADKIFLNQKIFCIAIGRGLRN